MGTLIFEGRFSNRGQDYLLHAYNVELESEEFRLKEHQKVQWIDLTALQSLPMADSDRRS